MSNLGNITMIIVEVLPAIAIEKAAP